jgi:hypothetical protein
MRTITDNKCLASWAVFRRFGENEHKNRYEVLCEFIKASIYKHSLRSFTLSSLTEEVNNDYAFNLKEAVIAYAIQQLKLGKDQYSHFICNPDDYIEQKKVLEAIDSESSESQKVIQQLFAYVEKEKGIVLTGSERGCLIQSFINYILDNRYSDKYSNEISSFLVAFKDGNPISAPLDSILEGVVSYTGVTFDTPASSSSRWTTEMNVYLDTEIIFHMAGYNGMLYQKLFNDFYSFVEEINNDSTNNGGQKKIYLRYFPEVETEIDKFFDKAKDIVNNKVRLIPSVTAMKAITEGCNCDVDIDEKRGELDSLIKSHGIIKDSNPIDYYSENQYALNLEDQTIISKFKSESSRSKEKDIINALASLSHVNVLRKGKSNRSFENLKYVLLTDNFITKKLAWYPEIKNECEKPLSTDLYFITNRMWYRLGKAFGNGETPAVFDVISKAKIILSCQINNSVAVKYEELVQRMESGKITSESAIEVLYRLRNEVKNPEDIDNEQEAVEAMMVINQTDIDKYEEEKAYQKELEKKTRAENETLIKENKLISERNDLIQRENDVIKKLNVEVNAENKRLEKVNLELAEQIDETSVKVSQLEKSLFESQKREQDILDNIYKRDLCVFIRKKKIQARNNLLILITFFLAAVIADWLAKKNNVQITNGWVQSICTYVLPQIIFFIRSYTTKINPVRMIRIIMGKDNKQLEKEFKEEWNLNK